MFKSTVVLLFFFHYLLFPTDYRAVLCVYCAIYVDFVSDLYNKYIYKITNPFVSVP